MAAAVNKTQDHMYIFVREGIARFEYGKGKHDITVY